MRTSQNTLASRPSLWAPYSPLFFDDDPAVPAGSVPEPAADATTPPETSPAAPETAPATPQGGTSEEPTAGFDTPFRLEDVPEGVREHVQRYNAQLQGAFTRKTMELADQRRQLAPVIELHEALSSDDEDARDDAIRRILADAGWDIDDDDDAEEALADAQAAGAVPTGGATTPTADSDTLARLAALEAEREQERSTAYVTEFNRRIDTGLETYAKGAGFEDGKAPQHVREQVLALVKSLGPDEDGYPQIDQATSLYEAGRQAELQRYIASKDTPELDLSGPTSAERKFDPRDPKSRLEMANAIAGRHV